MNRSSTASFLFSLAVAVTLFCIVKSQISFWDSSYPFLFGAFRYSFLFLCLPLFIASFLFARGNIKGLSIVPEAFACSLILVFLSDWFSNDWTLLSGNLIRGELILFFVLGLFLSKGSATFWKVTLVLFIGVLFSEFIRTSEGRLLFSDDNGPVLYRLSMLKSQFPFIPFYQPQWNAGLDARDFFATGILNLFFIFSPIIYTTDIFKSYNFIVGTVLFCILPASTYLGAKILDFKPSAREIAAILALTTSLVWYRWGLKYGSMGFVTSATLFPLVCALLIKVLKCSDETVSKLELVLLCLSGTLMLFWSMSGIAILPLLIFILFRIKSVLKITGMKWAIIITLAINIPWIVMLASVSKVGTFVSLQKDRNAEMRDQGLTPTSGAVQQLSARSVKGASSSLIPKKSLREYLTTMNPLILFLIIPGFLLLPRSLGIYLGSTIIWLWFLGSVVKGLKPQLELDRMMVLSGLLMSFPAALAVNKIFERKGIAASIAFSFLLAGMYATGGIVNNRSMEQYAFADSSFDRLPDLINQSDKTGRVVFLGFVLHEWSRGHLAPLAIKVKQPLVASSPYHNVWWYTDVVPGVFSQKGEAGIEEYLDLMNAKTVVAHEVAWQEYCRLRRDRYLLIGKAGDFHVYKRQSSSSYVLSGDVEVLSQGPNELKLRVNSAEAVIKFNYFYFLESSGCTISPEPIIPGAPFIRLSNCAPNSEVVIRGKTGIRRLLARIPA